MRPLVFSVPTYSIAFSIAIAVWVVPERIGSFWWRSSRDPDARRQDRWSYVVLTAAIVMGWGLGFSLALDWTNAAIPWFRSQLTVAGIVLVLSGVALRWWAIISLGRYFTVDVAVRSSQAVLESGPYRVIRHPAYSGVLLICLGVGLALANWAGLVAVFCGGLFGLLYRVRVEERALTEALGQAYVDYMHHTKRFIPFLV